MYFIEVHEQFTFVKLSIYPYLEILPLYNVTYIAQIKNGYINVVKQSIFNLSCFVLIKYKRVMQQISTRFARLTTCQSYLLSYLNDLFY